MSICASSPSKVECFRMSDGDTELHGCTEDKPAIRNTHLELTADRAPPGRSAQSGRNGHARAPMTLDEQTTSRAGA